MQHTSNYGLKKPEYTDLADIKDINDNADIIDQKLKEIEDSIENIEVPVTSINGKTGDVELSASDIGAASQGDFQLHKNEIATEEQLGHVKIDGQTIQANNGVISAVNPKIIDEVTGEKWEWKIENGIVFLERSEN